MRELVGCCDLFAFTITTNTEIDSAKSAILALLKVVGPMSLSDMVPILTETNPEIKAIRLRKVIEENAKGQTP